MSGTQLLRLLVNERLAAAAEEIFGLVEKTIAEYQDEAARSKREVNQLKKQLEQLTVLNPKVILFRADTQSVSEEVLPSQQPDQLPIVEENETRDSHQVKEEKVDLCIIPHLEDDSSEDVKVRLTQSETTSQTDCQLFPTFSAITVTLNEDDEWHGSDGSPSCGPRLGDTAFTKQEQAQKDEKACRFCGKQFHRDSDLIRHVDEIHMGEKAFKCSECDKKFARRDHLAVHLRIHTGLEPGSLTLSENQHGDRSEEKEKQSQLSEKMSPVSDHNLLNPVIRGATKFCLVF
ncbi:zinc finger protein 543-like isoform X2 [Siniperca chuatsi]|uniref:zinc finger protein 543-like isoform X2 n=1 Tax=Siniperca chuatsi TaxID=119488 RepID=UPI001CE1142D|nr:zinc finger protein 543-like isoform X2 [Siniperca chuatsi]